MTSPLRARTPAAFAEQYIIESIWQERFPPGSALPAERELSELIGVTRTTLREVLQRLARDGWLTIQHGRPTRVNNYWETAGLNILDTLACLDDSGELDLVWQLLEARTAMAAVFLRAAIKRDPEPVVALLKESEDLSDDAVSFINFDWKWLHTLTRATGNTVYTLILNGFKTLYKRVGRYYFSKPEARRLARDFYRNLAEKMAERDTEAAISLLYKYGREGGAFYKSLREEMPPLTELDEMD
ncbi:MAG: fatty acid metabolism transcriptional regulator FadR [Gammaproteobacteria bacterium]|nr:MAG: fatty acid metabolism transcriptional regulator FadR [Gammaproteobacteria bacterium]